MNYSGDAAEQIVRMSLEGVEVAARITGTAAKEIAMLLIAALKSKSSTLKPRGKARLISMLKSGKPLEILSVRENDLQKFMSGAKEYGIVYCALRNTKSNPDGLCDILVKADDAPKISRLTERFKFATVDKAKIESEIVAERAAAEAKTETVPNMDAEPEAPDKDDTERLLDELLGTDEGKAKPDTPEPEKTEPEQAAPVKTVKEQADNPPLARGDSEQTMPSPSGPTSENVMKQERVSSSRPSVREEIREITAARKRKEADAPQRNEPNTADKQRPAQTTTTHKQPQRGKSNKNKGAR
jgi:hypothetical protein